MPPKSRAATRLWIVIILTTAMMIAEIAGGLLFRSLALLSDAGHMFTHLFSLVVALFALRLATRPTSVDSSYGFYRAEILAAFVNGLTILLIVAYIVYEAVMKLVHPVDVAVTQMFVLAVVGLLVNLACAGILWNVSGQDLNVKGAWVHLLSDTFSSAAIVAGALVMMKTGWMWVDPALSVVIAAVICVWGVNLLRSSVRVLMEVTPVGINPKDLYDCIRSVDGVLEVHDLHVWELSTDMYAMTGHILVPDITIADSQRILREINDQLSRRFNIGHTTFQFETR